MDLLLAIKDEETSVSGLHPASAFLPGILSPTVYRCPHCHSVYKVIFGPGEIFLGEGKQTCAKCKREFRDRSKEWPMITFIDRMFFLFPMMVGGWMLVTILACVLAAYGDWKLGNVPLLLPVAVFLVAPLFVWFVVRFIQVLRSVSRFKLRGQTKAV